MKQSRFCLITPIDNRKLVMQGQIKASREWIRMSYVHAILILFITYHNIGAFALGSAFGKLSYKPFYLL